MGAKPSKSSIACKESSCVNARVNVYGSGGGAFLSHELEQSKLQGKVTTSRTRESMDIVTQETKQIKEPVSIREVGVTGYGGNEDGFYDGIPRFPGALSQKSRSTSSKQAAAVTVSVVSARLGRAGTFGLEKAVQVLDTLGSSMTNLNTGSGFLSGPTIKGSELSVLAFEVANTIMKGSSLMQSLSKRSIRLLQEVVFPSEGVQNLVSKDTDELLRTVAADKRVELNIFSKEVVRFGNRCKDPRWHNLDRYFEKQSRGLTPPKQLKEDAEYLMQQLMNLVQYTAELYHELQTLDILEEAHKNKHQRVANLYANSSQRGDEPTVLKADLKTQRKQVKLLKKKSLWSRSMEEVMEKLVDIVVYLNREIQTAFGCANDNAASNGSLRIQQKLGSAGLALHYANIVLQIDSIVARSSSMPSNVRDTLYQSLPPNIKSSLRSKLHSFSVEEELSITEIKAEMEKTMCWLAPIATNTAKAHHGFGWIGEWANTGSDGNRKSSGLPDLIQIETFHYADKERTEACILELVLWLNHLILKSKDVANGGGMRSPVKSPIPTTSLDSNGQLSKEAASAPLPILSTEDQKIMQPISVKECARGQSKSQDFEDNGLKKHDKLSESSGHSGTITKESNKLLHAKMDDLDKEKAKPWVGVVE